MDAKHNAKVAARMTKRIVKEFQQFHKAKKQSIKTGDKTLQQIDAVQINNNIRHVQLVVRGPPDTPYEGGFYEFRVYMKATYPTEPPLVTLRTRIFHPNINGQGKICLNILKDDGWSPATSLKNLALSLQNLLADPNIDDPLDVNVTKVFKEDPELAVKTAKEWNDKYASVDPILRDPEEEEEVLKKKEKKHKHKHKKHSGDDGHLSKKESKKSQSEGD